MMYSVTIDRVPVFRDGRLSGFEYRGLAEQPARSDSRDLADALHALPWLDTDDVGVTVEGGVVHLNGHVDSIHTVLALRRLAAAAPGTAAIVDEMWVDCE